MKQLNILIIDDEEEFLDIIYEKIEGKITFKDVGEVVIKFAQSAVEGFNKIITEKKFDLILLDINLENIKGGFTLCKRIKKEDYIKEIPVIFITSHTHNDEEIILEAYKTGGVDYITKNSSDTEIIERIKCQLEIKLKKEEIADKNREIIDSINSAKIIQDAVIHSPNKIKEFLPESFVIMKPKAIVSGDFYYVNTRDNKIILAACDCTGHGVPGAFMSILCNKLINETVSNIDIVLSPEVLLNEIRNNIIKILDSKIEKMENKDGMDAALVIIDQKNLELNFSGAKNPCYIVREQNAQPFPKNSKVIENNGFSLLELKGNRFPVGIHTDELTPFNNHTVQLNNGDRIYIFSDGFADQFGGAHGKKFNYVRFKELLLEIQNLEMSNQKLEILKKFSDWQGNLEQVDDLLIIGIQV